MSVELKYVNDEDVVDGEYVVSEGVEIISNTAFAGLENLKRVILPKSLKEIKFGAFRDCENLETIEIKDGVEFIDDMAFYGCDSLKSISLPDSVTHIGKSEFSDCYELARIKLPRNLETIESKLFTNCNKITHIELPKSLKRIKEKAFSDCKQLKEIKIPESVNEILENVFEGCVELKEVSLPDKLKVISPYLFNGCTGLEKIKLPSNLELIDHKAFFNCKSITEIEFPKSLKTIESFAFCCCDGLENIVLPDSLIEISDRAFQDCGYIQSVHLPEKIQILDEYVFKGCANLRDINIPTSISKLENGLFSFCSLREVVIPNNITEIGDRTFENCLDMTDIKLPKNLVKIGQGAFYNCNGISSLELPNSLKEIDSEAFGGCLGIKNLVIPDGVVNIGKNAFKDCEFEKLIVPSSVKNFPFVEDDQFGYFTKLEDGFMLSKKPTPTSLDADLLGVNYAFLSSNWKYHEKIFNEVRNPVIKNFYNSLVYDIKDNYDLLENFMESHTFTFYKKFMKLLDDNKKKTINENRNSNYIYPASYFRNQERDLGKMLFNLGAFGVETTLENGKRFNYAHQISGFLDLKLERGEVQLKNLLETFKKTEIKGFNKDFNEFFINNFDELMEEEKLNNGFISKCYNDFDEVQATHTSNKGHQRKLKSTVEKFRKYFLENKFEGVTEENIEIARTIAPWFDRQESFDEALQIYDELKTKKIPTNIVGKHLKDDVVFDKIDKYSSKIRSKNVNTFENLFSVVDAQFSFEWLEKNDPRNLILGKLCTCCSHIEGAGFSIMHASMVDPNVQNLVIKDDKNTIIAKSTIYINKKEGYGVFNNIEVNDELIGNYENMNLIYRKFIEGANLFVDKYNAKNKKNPLKVVTVGTNNNDLLNILRRYHRNSPEIFRSIDYSDYGVTDRKHKGDSDDGQIIVWKAKDFELKDPAIEILSTEI